MTCVAFCHDSSLVATGDMSGLIKVWSVEKRQEVWSFEVSDLEVGMGTFPSLCSSEVVCSLKDKQS